MWYFWDWLGPTRRPRSCRTWSQAGNDHKNQGPGVFFLVFQKKRFLFLVFVNKLWNLKIRLEAKIDGQFQQQNRLAKPFWRFHGSLQGSIPYYIYLIPYYMSYRKNPGNTKFVLDGHLFMEIDGNCFIMSYYLYLVKHTAHPTGWSVTQWKSLSGLQRLPAHRANVRWFHVKDREWNHHVG